MFEIGKIPIYNTMHVCICKSHMYLGNTLKNSRREKNGGMGAKFSDKFLPSMPFRQLENVRKTFCNAGKCRKSSPWACKLLKSQMHMKKFDIVYFAFFRSWL